MDTQRLERFYSSHHDEIRKKRYESPYFIRRSVHREMYGSIFDRVATGAEVLDAGCGEGVLSLLLADKAKVTAVDLSEPNIAAAKKFADADSKLKGKVAFAVGDAAKLPFAENSFDCVVSNHVLEHLPDFDAGIRELYRVTRRQAVIAVPTCLNPGAWALLGGDTYWAWSWKSFFAVPLGFLRVIFAALTRAEGVNEGYAGRRDNVHVFRFPWIVRRKLERAGFRVVTYEAQTLCVPYWDKAHAWLKSKNLNGARGWRNLGLGTVYVVEKTPPVLTQQG